MTEEKADPARDEGATIPIASIILIQSILTALRKHHPETYATVVESVNLARNHKLGELNPQAMSLIDIVLQNKKGGASESK